MRGSLLSVHQMQGDGKAAYHQAAAICICRHCVANLHRRSHVRAAVWVQKP